MSAETDGLVAADQRPHGFEGNDARAASAAQTIGTQAQQPPLAAAAWAEQPQPWLRRPSSNETGYVVTQTADLERFPDGGL
jgi:hypothetical protein